MLKRYPVLFILTFFLLLCIAGRAQNSVTVKRVLEGNKNELVADATLQVQDSIYFNTDRNKLVLPYQIRNVITFKVDEYNKTYLPDAYTASVTVLLTYTYLDGGGTSRQDTVSTTLKINSDTSRAHDPRATFVFNNAQNVIAKIVGIQVSKPNAIKALVLENEMNILPVYKLDRTADAVKNLQHNNPPNTDATDEIMVTWNAVTGADMYDLEWAYVDYSVLSKYQSQPSLIFENNATRVSVRGNSYSIPLLYDNAGSLFVRVRAVQQQNKKARLYTIWSTEVSGASPLSYVFKGHQQKVNWQSNVTYAEDGKRKAVVQYFDGSMRNRQTVTKDNITQRTIVGETYYDQQGRPAVQVLPSPSLSNIIQYSRSFNVAAGGQEYAKDQYDYLASPLDYRRAHAAPLDSVSGASQYYSSLNPDKDNGVNRYIPAAGGYPLTETVYTPDNTGRISKQSGVGPEYQVASGHETIYSYAGATQNQLDVLFGTEVGDEKHYFRNTVRDANGQYSVSYLDMHGRTIATALSGSPENTGLKDLESKNTVTVTDSLSTAAKNLVQDLVAVSHKTQQVETKGNHSFHYSFTPPVVTVNSCAGTPLSYIGLYELEIRITDNENNQLLPNGEPYVKVLRNYNAGQIIESGITPGPMEVSFDLVLDKGSYEITKSLRISKDGLDYYKEKHLPQAVCKTLQEFEDEQNDVNRWNICQPDCEACKAQLSSFPDFRDTMLLHMGWNAPTDSITHRSEIQLAYNKALDDCKALCQSATPYDDMRKALLLDMTAPSGQYADPAKLKDPRSIFYPDEVSKQARYASVTTDYLDANGQPSLVYDQISGLYVKPQELQPDQFAQNFQPSWAENLLPFHPEYGMLVKYETFKASMEWDAKVKAIDSYDDAWREGYLNPTMDHANDPFPSQTWSLDALAKYNNGALKTELQNGLANYKENLSLWSLAAISTVCDASDKACRLNRSDTYRSMLGSSAMSTGDKNMMWRMFRDLYIGLKQKVIYNQLRAACPNCPTDVQLTQEGRNPNFINDMGALNQAYGDLINRNSEETTRTSSQAYLAQQYKENCKAYVQTWISQLSKCTNYNQAALTEITDALLQVCMQGADVDHPMGASSVRPSSTATLRSFEDVINDYNFRHGIPKTEFCNGMLVTIPAPYEKQQPAGNKPLFSKPSDCECNQINTLYREYQTFGQPAVDTSFSAYLSRTRKVNMYESDLTILRNACNGQFSGHFFEAPIELPPLLQCNTGGVCVTCVEFNTAYNSYVANYPLMTPKEQPANENEIRFNILFENYMNNKLGLNRTAADYLAFKSTCVPGSYTADTVCTGSGVGVIPTYTLMPNLPRDMIVKDIKQTSDYGFIMVGSVIRNNGSGANEEACVMRVDANANVVWAKIYSSSEDEYFSRIKPTRDSGYILSGKATKSGGIKRGQVGIITKINSAGVQQWTRAIDAGTFNGEDVRDVTELSNGDIAFAGCYDLTSSQSKFLVGIISGAGDVTRWVKSIGRPNVGDMAYRIEQEQDTLVVAGLTNSDNHMYGAALMKLSRLDGAIISRDLYENGSTKNDIGDLYKMDFGYRLALIQSNDWVNTTSSLVVLDINRSRSVRTSSRILSGSAGVDHLAVAQTTDWGTLISPVYNAPNGYSFLKLDVNNNVSWANRVAYQIAPANTVGGVVPMTGRLSSFARISGNGSFAAAIHLDGHPGVLELDDQGRAGCSDTAYSVTSSPVMYTVAYDYPLGVENPLTDVNKPYPFIITDLAPVTNQNGCGTVRNCSNIYKGPYLCPVVIDGSDSSGWPGNANEINGCSDNNFFIKSKSIELYRQYWDSISNNFEERYLASLRDAFNKEQFTVIHDVSEYHYTLYYYDQAGNLLKTIPPQGVVIDTTVNWLKRVRDARAGGQTLVPAHTLATNYRYNSLNQVIAQQSPDGGMTRFWYDRLGRLAVSQNARQIPNQYSYTLYDELGRVTEVGELANSEAMTPELSRSRDRLSQWIVNAGSSRRQITRTVYDQPNNLIAPVLSSNNVRNRVSYSMVYDNIADTVAAKYISATFYSYDIHGNVDTLVQDYKRGTMADSMNRFKKLIYDYDLLSGKVNQVAYQPGYKDALYHRYLYDAENRLTNVETSRDSIYWENDAFYQYYKHGPLARAVIGQQQVQGIDYAYTLQGWLKGVNGSGAATDMGNDAQPGSPVAKDAYGFTLHYYGNGDFRPIGTGVKSLPGINTFSGFRPLYNGNIAAMGVHVPILGEPLLYTYQYDVLHRIAGMDANRNLDATSNNWAPQALPDFQERVTYDGNGNILKYLRNGNNTFAGKSLQMDSLSYYYKPGTNQLDYIRDAIGNTAYGSDIDDQSAHNYAYDAIGNLTSDRAAGIDSIVWNVYGKIKRIRKTNGSVIDFAYDVAGNRISKSVDGVLTLYVRDATGNVMGVYAANDNENGKGRLIQREAHLYGSSRLGMSTRQVVVDTTQVALPAKNGIGIPKMLTFTRGEKLFELSNHLGNVLATVSDRKKPVSADGTLVDHYDPVISSAQDYYPFGSLMPGRSGYLSEGGWTGGGPGGVTIPATLTVDSRSNNTPAEYAATDWIDFTAGFESGTDDAFVAVIKDAGSVPGEGSGGTDGTARGYRYGFNGKENDNEIKGEGNQQDYGMRIYDPRVGKFLSVDPLVANYSYQSPYLYAGDNPIVNIDVEGMAAEDFNVKDPPTKRMPGLKNDPHRRLPDPHRVEEGGKIIRQALQVSKYASNNPFVLLARLIFSPLSAGEGSSKPHVPTQEEVLKEAFQHLTNNPDQDLTDDEKKALAERINSGMATQNDKLYYRMMALKLGGSGPVAGVFTLSRYSKSAKAIANYYPSFVNNQIEFVFDPENEVFAVGKPRSSVGGLSPHEKLGVWISADPNQLIGGMFSRRPDGSIQLDDNSGHYHQNWTLQKAAKLKAFMEEKTGKQVHINYIKKTPPEK